MHTFVEFCITNYAEFCILLQNSASKSANLCGILHYNTHVEVSMCRSSHYNCLRRYMQKVRLSSSAKLKSDFAHTWYSPFKYERICLFGMASMPFLCNGTLLFQGNLPRVLPVTIFKYASCLIPYIVSFLILCGEWPSLVFNKFLKYFSAIQMVPLFYYSSYPIYQSIVPT